VLIYFTKISADILFAGIMALYAVLFYLQLI